MKYKSKFLALALIALVACQSAVAQLPTPTISAKYNNDEISKMVEAHKRTHSQDIRPNATLHAAFTKDFPNSRDIDWEIAANLYEVEFEIGRIDYKAYYDENGNLVMYSHEVKEMDLPAVVKNAAMDKYPNGKFEDYKKVVKGTKTFYIVELEKGETDIKATFDPKGTFIQEIFD